ncbi:MAG: hypothetical protein ACP5N1_00735 [Candidatus Woesearchaeota archaeon]
MFKSLKKRGYYFVIDALIGSTIIFLTLMVLLNGGTKPNKIQYNYELAEEYSSFILQTQLQDLNNPYVNKLIIDGNINDTTLTIMEQVDLFYYNNQTVYAAGIIQNLTESLISPKYGFSYYILVGSNRTEIYTRTPSPINLDDARIVIASNKITFLQINSSTLFGPALTEIKIWL